MNPIKHIFNFTDGQVHDASVSEISDVFQVCFNYTWLLTPISTGLDASPKYSFEVSNDNINWQEYDAATKDAAINQPFDDDHMPGLYFRISYDADTNTTGTVSFELTLKP